MGNARFRFGEYLLDGHHNVLSRRGSIVSLPPMAVRLLLLLVRHGGEPASKDYLMDALWPDSAVEESNLTQYIYMLRRALRDGGLAHAIETIPRRGYRFTILLNRQAPAPRRWSWASATLGILAIACSAVGFSPRPSADAFSRLSLESQRLYRLGRFQLNLRTMGGIDQSLRDFTSVTARDPQNPLGYSGLADAYIAFTTTAATIATAQVREHRPIETRGVPSNWTRSRPRHTHPSRWCCTRFTATTRRLAVNSSARSRFSRQMRSLTNGMETYS